MALNSTVKALLHQSRKALQYGRKNGISQLVALARTKLRGNLFGKNHLIDYYDFLGNRLFGPPIASGSIPVNTINWVVPPFGYGSGGHLNIFRFVQFLEEDGFDCRIVVVGEPQPLSASQASKQINEWFFQLNAEVYLGIESAPPAQITIATSWTTAYYVKAFQSTVHRCYFIQDFEPYFYPLGAEYAWAEATYTFGFFGITAGTWLKDKLAKEFGMRTEAFGFSFDQHIYAPRECTAPTARSVFFYARPPTPRRGFEMGLLVLNEVVRRLPDVQVIFAGWDISNYHIPFAHQNCGSLSLNELPDIYSQCKAALVLSFTNLSLLPLELMACGTPVVSNRAPCTEWLLNDRNSRLAPPTVDALADALCTVLEDPNEAARLRQGGFATAAATDWRMEARKVGDVLRSLDALGGAM